MEWWEVNLHGSYYFLTRICEGVFPSRYAYGCVCKHINTQLIGKRGAFMASHNGDKLWA